MGQRAEFRQIEKEVREEEISLREYWEIVLRYRIIVLITAVSVFIVSLVVAFMQPKMYLASVELVRNEVNALLGDGRTRAPDTAMIDMLQQKLRSKQLMQRAAKNSLAELQKLAEEGFEVTPKDEAIAAGLSHRHFSGAMESAYTDEYQSILKVQVRFHSAAVAAAMVNAVEQSLTAEVKRYEDKKFLKKKNAFAIVHEQKKAEMDLLDRKIRTLRETIKAGETPLAAVAGAESHLLSLYTKYQDNMQAAQLKWELLKDQYGDIQRQLGIEHLELDKVVWVDMSDSMRQKLQALKIKRQELTTRYTDENPSIIKIDHEINSILEILKESKGRRATAAGSVEIPVGRLEMSLVYDITKINREIITTQAEVQELQSQIDNVQKQLFDLPIKTRPLSRLINQKEILAEVIHVADRNLQEITVAYETRTKPVELVERAIPAGSPYAPNIKKTAMVAVVAGLFIGVAIALLLNMWDNTIPSSYRLKSEIHYDVLGVIPKWEDGDAFIDPATPDSPLGEVYGVLRNNIRYCGEEGESLCVMLASAVQGEGKTHTAANLATSFALEGNNVMLVSLDFRKTKNFAALRREGNLAGLRGLTDYIRGDIGKEEVVQPSLMPNLWLVPSGSRANNPTPLLRSRELHDFLMKAQESFDVVIVDAPAILPVVDATVVTGLVKSILLIVEAASTPINVVQQALARLEHAKAPIIGSVLNKVKDMRLDSFYGHGYSYYDHYSAAGYVTDEDDV